MGLEAVPSSVTTGPSARPLQQRPPQKELPFRAAASSERLLTQQPSRAGTDSKRAKSGRAGAGLGLAKTKLWVSAGSQSKPLLPVTERVSHEENLAGRRTKKGSRDGDKWDITPDGGSAGREGRQFAVANVGNNGRIYLR